MSQDCSHLVDLGQSAVNASLDSCRVLEEDLLALWASSRANQTKLVLAYSNLAKTILSSLPRFSK
jgi:hypothetical protein